MAVDHLEFVRHARLIIGTNAATDFLSSLWIHAVLTGEAQLNQQPNYVSIKTPCHEFSHGFSVEPENTRFTRLHCFLLAGTSDPLSMSYTGLKSTSITPCEVTSTISSCGYADSEDAVFRCKTEAYTCHLVDLLKGENLLDLTIRDHEKGLNIVDFCTGTGCIPLLLFSSLRRSISQLNVVGVDVSSDAIKLARENITHNVESGSIPQSSSGQSLEIIKGDIFQDTDIQKLSGRPWDVMVSNPPYISRRVWNYGLGQLGHSVRKYEPSLALVPGNHLPAPAGWRHADVFYSRLLDIAHQLKPRIILLEIGDEEQARHVIGGFFRHKLSAVSRVEVWRDWPDLTPNDGEEEPLKIDQVDGQTCKVPVKGSGQIRSILIKTQAKESE
ncbi:Release factor glutamine methyltransferase-like protein [Cladobotryum mycophilum]|uniref:Release factor glutamine methyltransferase-like protein n=1 Tax=Cladobotryum mycophilum TaxID=491253 RepID=A0ABR0SNQ4_9HYPO